MQAHAQPTTPAHHPLLELCLETLELRVPGTMARMARIEQIAGLIGRQIRFSDDQRFVAQAGARYQALGALGLPDDLARACVEGRVKDTAQLQHYTRIAGRYVFLAYPQMPELVETIWYQFERPDGGGPYGLEAELLPRTANLVALSRAVHALLTTKLARGESLVRWAESFDALSGRVFQPDLLAALHACASAILRLYRPPPPQSKPNPSEHSPRQGGSAAPRAQGQAASRPATVGARPRPDELLEQLEPLIPRQKIEAIVRRMELRPLAAAVQNLLAVTASPECSIHDVAEALMADQVLSVRILKLANSSAYATGKPVRTVREAVARIGIQEVRTLAMALDVIEQFEAPAAKYLDTRLLLEHSVGVGLLAAALGRVCPGTGRDDLFLMGALHDLGRLLLAEQLPEIYAEVCRVATEQGLPLHKVEQRLLHIDHAEITRRVLENWSFDADFCAAVGSHHASASELRRLGRERIASAAILALANRLAHAALIGCSGEPTIDPLDDLVDLLGIDAGRFGGILRDVHKETRDLRISLAMRSTSGSWPDAMELLRHDAREAVQPCVVDLRPERDPVRLALEQLYGSNPDDPTVAVLYVGPGMQPDALLAELTKWEAEQGRAEPLPVVFVLSDAGQQSAARRMPDRKGAVLHMPVRIDRLLRVCGELSGRTTSVATG